jgi:hypothetical protein
MTDAERLEAEAEQIIAQDLLKLSAGRTTGTAARLVRILVDAAKARVLEELKEIGAKAQPAKRPTLGVSQK